MRPAILAVLGVLNCGQPDVVHQENGAVATPYADTLAYGAAIDALAAGRPWHASRLLEPALRDSSQRSPALVLLAARAAAAWRGWPEVERLLGAQPWLDTLEGGAGRALLAQAAFERGRPDAADQAARAVELPGTHPQRLVLLARSLERGGATDSARATYLRAAAEFPSISDWLRLRAAALTGDSSARAAVYASSGGAPARLRIPYVEAAALERSGNLAGAIRAHAALDAPVEVLRLRLMGEPDSSSRAEIRKQLLVVIASGSRHAWPATELLDRSFVPRTAAEELIVARSAAKVGPPARAAAGFAQAASRGLLNDQDRFTYGTVLSRLGRDREATAQFAAVRTGPLAGRASYQRARSLLRAGDGGAARTALEAVASTHSADTAAASSALYLRGDLATDDRQDATGRTLYLSVGRRYPTSSLAPSARFRAALIAFTTNDFRSAALEFDSLATRHPNSSEAVASMYWSGRALASAGDTAAAAARWRQVMQHDRQSYYAVLSARRLGSAAWRPAAAADSFARFTSVDSGFARARLLDELGMNQEAGYEYQQLVNSASASPERLLATAAAFRTQGLAPRAMALARQALSSGATADARTYRLLYPIGMRDVLLAEAAANDVDHALVAALIRQESGFDPRATSPVGARGLMQIMPEVGRQLASGRRYATWDAALLYQPDVSLQLGTAHLADLLRGYPSVERALAAYNAGGSRVDRWAGRHGVADPEIFVERIPYVETRDYVRIVLRNREFYRALHPVPGSGGHASGSGS